MAQIAINFGIALGMQFISYLLTPAVDGPRLSDLSAPKSQYGSQIPWVWGSVRLTGTLFWAQDIIERRQGGKGLGPKVRQYEYFGQFAVLLCKGPIVGVRRLWLNSDLVYDVSERASDEVLRSSAEFARKYFRIHLGTANQQPDPLIEAIEGVDKTPAYRHRAYLVFEDLPLADYGNRFPAVSVEVVTCGESTEMSLGEYNPFEPFPHAEGSTADDITARTLTPGQANLAGILYQICLAAGLQSAELDLAEIDRGVTGFYISSATSWREAIASLQQAYQFDVIESAGILRFINQERPGIVQTIPTESLAAHESGNDRPADYEIQRTQNLEIPTEVQINFPDQGFEYQQGMQYARRFVDEATSNQSQFTVPVVLTASEAKTIAYKSLLLFWIRRMTYRFSLGLQHGLLDPGDLVALPVTDGLLHVVLSKVNLGANLLLECEAMGYDAAIYEYQTTVPEVHTEQFEVSKGNQYQLAYAPILEFISLKGADGTEYQEGDDYTINLTTGVLTITDDGDVEDDSQVITTYLLEAGARRRSGHNSAIKPAQGSTTLAILDLPLLKSSDSAQGVYVLGAGGAGWFTAGLYAARSGQEHEFVKELNGVSTLGKVSAPLPAASPFVINEQSLLVDLFSGELATVSEAQMIAGQNTACIGAEIVRFQEAVLIAPKRYRLRRLVRGAYGTEWAIGSHQPNERFALLTGYKERVQGELSDLGQLLRFKGPVPGQSLDEVPSFDKTIEGNSLKPYAPTAVMGERDDDGNLTIAWARRDRRGVFYPLFAEMPMSEVKERYEVEILDGTAAVVRTLKVDAPTVDYAAVLQVADFGAVQESVSVRVFQMSATVGRGFAAGVTV